MPRRRRGEWYEDPSFVPEQELQRIRASVIASHGRPYAEEVELRCVKWFESQYGCTPSPWRNRAKLPEGWTRSEVVSALAYLGEILGEAREIVREMRAAREEREAVRRKWAARVRRARRDRGMAG